MTSKSVSTGWGRAGRAREVVGELVENPKNQETSLRALEEQIEQSLDNAWYALREIQERSLYKIVGYKSFKDYCEQRWGYSKSHAHRLIEHTKIVDILKGEGVQVLPNSEGQTRPLIALKRKVKDDNEYKQKVVEAWQIAADTAPEVLDEPRITGDHVQSVMSQFGISRSYKKPDNADAEELRRRLNALAETGVMAKTGGAEFVQKHGKGSLGRHYRKVLEWLIDADQEAMNS